MNFQDRFWSKVDRSGECWEWQAARNRLGYGLVGVGRKSVLAHRVAYELTKGPIPKQMLVRHRCDNPSCVRPDHLIIGTPLDNVRDSIDRGRRASFKGMRNGRVKLTDEQVREIRRLYAMGNTTILLLASQFGVSKSQIYNIISGAQRREWNEVPQ